MSLPLVTTPGVLAEIGRSLKGCPRAKRVALAATLTELFFIHKGFGGARTIKADLDNRGIEACLLRIAHGVVKDRGLCAQVPPGLQENVARKIRTRKDAMT